MSIHAPWLALACDWHESELFEGTTAGQKLSFIALLCFTKSRGRAGRLTIRPKSICRDFGVSPEDLECMLNRAVKHRCITRDGNEIRFENWRTYQDPTQRRSSTVLLNHTTFNKMSQTKDQSPITKDQSPRTKDQGPRTSKRGKGTPKNMLIPTKEECVEHGKSIDMLESESEQFFNYQMAKGWLVGTSPMKSWKHAMRTWKTKVPNFNNLRSSRHDPNVHIPPKLTLGAIE